MSDIAIDGVEKWLQACEVWWNKALLKTTVCLVWFFRTAVGVWLFVVACWYNVALYFGIVAVYSAHVALRFTLLRKDIRL